LNILRSLDDSVSIIVGRTGSGKTALLEEFHRRKGLNIKISPEDLGINYVADNMLLKVLSDLGVNMDLFYRMLWKHIFVTELLKKHYKIDNENRKNNFVIEWQRKTFDSKGKQVARDYLIRWGDSIWQETEHRVIEQTDSLVNSMSAQLEAALGTGPATVSSKLEQLHQASQEKKIEVVQRGQQIVNTLQMNVLSDLVILLNDDMSRDKGKIYYITIDKLDENWVDDTFRHALIRSLLETVRELNRKFSTAKIIVALRKDLIYRVFNTTFQTSYQGEKIDSICLQLTIPSPIMRHFGSYRVGE